MTKVELAEHVKELQETLAEMRDDERVCGDCFRILRKEQNPYTKEWKWQICYCTCDW